MSGACFADFGHAIVCVDTAPEKIAALNEARPGIAIGVASNPEFLREGAAIADFKRPDRIVIGADDAQAAAVVSELYRPLYLNQAPILVTSRRTAELTKHAANAFLATKITFINEIADPCEQVDAGATAAAYDPEGVEQAQAVLSKVGYATDPYACAAGAHALVIVTEWDAFRALDLERLRAAMAEPVMVDLRNVYPRSEAVRHGFTYAGVGTTPRRA